MVKASKQLLNTMEYFNIEVETTEAFKQNHQVIKLNNKFYIVGKDGNVSKSFKKIEAVNKAIKEATRTEEPKAYKLLSNTKHNEKTLKYKNDIIKTYNYIIIPIISNQKRINIFKQNFIYKAFNPDYQFEENDVIDHINGVKTDNRLTNLRQFTKQQNSQAYHQEQKQKITNLNDIKDEFIEFYKNNKSKDIGKIINEFNEFKYIGYTDNVHFKAYNLIKNIKISV